MPSGQGGRAGHFLSLQRTSASSCHLSVIDTELARTGVVNELDAWFNNDQALQFGVPLRTPQSLQPAQWPLPLRNDRFENVCRTNGDVTRLSAVAAAVMPKADAQVLLRYANTIMHIYYFLLSGPMDGPKWELFHERGLLTYDEIALLKKRGSPGAVVYKWMTKIIVKAGDRASACALVCFCFWDFLATGRSPPMVQGCRTGLRRFLLVFFCFSHQRIASWFLW